MVVDGRHSAFGMGPHKKIEEEGAIRRRATDSEKVRSASDSDAVLSVVNEARSIDRR